MHVLVIELESAPVTRWASVRVNELQGVQIDKKFSKRVTPTHLHSRRNIGIYNQFANSRYSH